MANASSAAASAGAGDRVGIGSSVMRGLLAGLGAGVVWWLVELAVNWAFGGVIPLEEALTVLGLDLAIAGVAGLVVGAVIGASRALRNEGTRRRVHWWLLRLPLVGRVTRGLNTARFTRTLSILTSSGVPALEALRISASVVGNLPMRDAVEEAAVRVREGGAIGRSLSQSKLFPAMSIHLISSGEASGELDSMLERAANHQESEMDSLLAMMLSVLEPLLIVVMGVVVLGIVMAILLPIFQINQLVR